TDPETDLAVLRIKAPESLPAARLGDSSQLQVGDWVIAIGTPFNLSSTVSAGIISNAGRELLSNQRTRFLQTDAAINPGNSGGPLVNLDGEVVGINTAIASSSGSFQGIGFAIPSSVARWVMSQLIETGSVQRGYLGVNIQETNTALAEQLGVGRRAGVLVAEVLPGTPAAEAGFEAGDVITEYAGKRVSTPRDLQELVERTAINSRERVTVVRDGRERQLQVMVKPLPSRGPRPAGLADEEPQEQPADDEGYADNDLGLEVADLTDETAQQLGFEGREGVLITGVESDSPADLIGLSEGMLILKVGKQTVTSLDEFKEALQKESLDEGVLLHVRTQAGNRFVVLKRE
ncbi:MAG: PDZ domain-containing protein, partial [Pirellulales bacterium]